MFQIAKLVRQADCVDGNVAAAAATELQSRSRSRFQAFYFDYEVLHFGMNNLRLRNIQ
ncbi:hypothetical protein ACLK19_25810 [Escherichia coli]